jgi:hypothetical protein
MRGSAALRTGVTPGGALAGPWGKSPLWAAARAVPSFDLPFSRSKSLLDAVTGESIVTFTRASSGTYFDSDGIMQTAASDVPRFDHDPTSRASLGLMIEGSATNSIRNNTMGGAATGTPGTLPTNWSIGSGSIGTLTQEVVGVGSIGVMSYIDIRYSGTTSTTGFVLAYEAPTQVAALTGELWRSTAYYVLVGGSKANISTWGDVTIERTAVGALVRTNFSDRLFQLSGNLVRTGYSGPLSGGATTAFVQPGVQFTFASGVSIDITLRICVPQLEKNFNTTSVILTSGTAVTRAADVATLSRQVADLRIIYGEAIFRGGSAFVSLDDGTANQRIEFFQSFTSAKLRVIDGGVTQADFNFPGLVSINTPTPNRLAVRLGADNFAASVDNASQTVDTSGTLPTVDRLRIGSNQAGFYHTGNISRITGWTTPAPLLENITR